MKKNIILLLILTVFPYMMCVLFSLFSDDIHIGQGDDSLKYHLLGKDIQIEINGLYKNIDVEEYVMGVLPGTIAADYDEEALKVQAILIRTNVLKEMEEKGTSDASDLSYTYLTMEDRVALFGAIHYEKYLNKFEEAVADTAGQVIRNENSLIMALYHEVSIGKTVGANEILGEDISYLQSVDSSQDVEAKHYMNIISYTWEELQSLEQVPGTEEVKSTEEHNSADEESGNAKEETLTNEETEAPKEQSVITKKSETPEKEEGTTEKIAISVTESTENGFVKQLSVNGTIYTGEEAMKKYGLSSTNFYVEEIEGGIRFVCLGKGNCMGVSQYGANRMALAGKKAEDIIKYYYQGVSLEPYR